MLARSRTNPKAFVVATQAAEQFILHEVIYWLVWYNQKIELYPIQLHLYACCFKRWPSELITWYSIRTIRMLAYGLDILKHSSLGWRDRRLSSGRVETPSDEIVVGRLSGFRQGNYFQGQTVFASFWMKSKDCKIHNSLRKESSVNLNINGRALPQHSSWRIINQRRRDLNNITSY